MKKINIIVLLVAVVAVGLGLMLSSGKRQTEVASQALFSDLQKHVDEVDSIRLENANGVILDAVLQDTTEGNSAWSAADKDNYPLDQEKVITLLNSLVSAKLDSAKTAKAENHSRLGLQDITTKDSQAQLLVVSAGERNWQILMGNTASSGKGVFVRNPGENQTWLTKTALTVPDDSNAWLQSRILNLGTDSLVSVSREGHWSAVVAQPETDGGTLSWTLENMPEGRELNYESIVKNTVDDILELELEELVQQKPYDLAGAVPESQITVTTSDEGEIEIALYKSGDDNLVSYNSENSNAHWSQWVYKVSDFQAGRLKKDIESFLQALPEEPEEEGAELQHP